MKKPTRVKLSKSAFTKAEGDQVIICGNRRYENINFDELVDSFGTIIRHNMLLPNNGYGKRNPSVQVLNVHIWDNYIKKASLETWLSEYEEVFGIPKDYIISFCKFLESDSVDFKHYKENNTELMELLLQKHNLGHFTTNFELRCGIGSIARAIKDGLKPYLIGFSVKEETSRNKQYGSRDAGDECHDEYSEVKLIKKLHEAGLVDATFCAIEDFDTLKIDCTILKPTKRSLNILEKKLNKKVECSINNKVAAVIPARSGSRRIKNKNISAFGDDTLIENKIKQLLNCRHIDTVIVATNDPAVKELCKNYDVSVLDREDRFCDEVSTTANEMIGDIASRIDDSFDIIMWAHCTNPLIQSDTYDDALNTFILSENTYDSLASVTEIKNHFWHETRSGFIPLNYNPRAASHPLAVQLEPLYFQDGGIFVQRRENMASNRYFFGNNPLLFKMNPYLSTDINHPLDMVIAEAINKTLGNKNGKK